MCLNKIAHGPATFLTYKALAVTIRYYEVSPNPLEWNKLLSTPDLSMEGCHEGPEGVLKRNAPIALAPPQHFQIQGQF